jgi:hypothetical protein
VSKGVVDRMEVGGKLPVRLTSDRLDEELRKITILFQGWQIGIFLPG